MALKTSSKTDFYRELEANLAKSTEEQRQSWAKTIVERNIDLEDLSELLRCEHRIVSRFLWMLSGIGLIEPKKLFDSLPFLVESVEKMKPVYRTAFANYWRIAGVPLQNEGKAIDWCFEWLLSAEANLTIKSRALFVLFDLTKKYPELKHELKICLIDQKDKYSKDFEKRVAKILKELE